MIFGEQEPKIITSSGTSIYFDHTIIVENKPVFNRIEHESKINGNRLFVNKGYHWVFKFKMNLFKYSDPLTKFEEIEGALFDNVTLYKHRDRDPFKDDNGDIVSFCFIELEPFYLDKLNFKDCLLLTFESTKFVKMVPRTKATLMIDGKDVTIGGNKIII